MTNTTATADTYTDVSVIGLGKMGAAMASALLTAGRRTTVWNRTLAKADALVASGAVRAESVADALRASPVAIISLGDYAAVRALLAAHPDALADRTVVNLTTGTPEEARELAEWVTSRGADYLDGAMLAVPQTVGTQDGFFLYSGAAAGFDAHRATLDVLASSHYLGEDPAVAELWDLALLGTGYATLIGFLHSLAILDTVQVPPAQFLPLATRWLHGMLAFLPELAGEVEAQQYGDGVSPVAMNRAAVANLIEASVRRGVDPAVHAPLRALLDRRTADGHGDDSFASLVELLRAGR
ncbi:NAD(P)-dependent oxidoreductase [Natronosporangium hydrolyticum]|uniref:NAD(P)-dependent oxidoreductase n=1 Tax=Natronosporangium hydrolyticum TaxID=2811111 RepID=A0A895YG48_9ACTN|nr:NAD(P)-binding domain-containing protein [Natronosporangium hydrolyticum]QSB15072.1 NAD(P)-dependent oxidoreductase [Natronosporangium hydrolyticum]